MKNLRSELFKTICISLLAVFSLVVFASIAKASIITVCSSGCDETSINDAIDSASDCDMILVYEGTYTENVNFDGKAVTVLAVYGPDYTTIDGDDSGSVVTFANSEEEDSVLIGFNITNGSGTQRSTTYHGGGIYIYGASPTIINCNINDNNVTGDGGGVWMYASSDPILQNCIITNNFAEINGGGIYATNNDSPTLIDCTISYNGQDPEEPSDKTVTGGGAWMWFNDVVIIGCDFIGNTAQYSGGINASGGTSTAIIKDVTIDGNTATSTGASGMYYIGTNSTITFENLTVKNNNGSYALKFWAFGSASILKDSLITDNNNIGIFLTNSSSGTIDNCEITNNDGSGIFGSLSTIKNCNIDGNTTSSTNGGGIHISGGSTSIQNCFITDNTATGGGGVYASGTTTIDSCTIAGNSASIGGGIYSVYDLDVNNSIIYGNTASSSGDEAWIYTSQTIYFDESDIDSSEVEGPGTANYTDCVNVNPYFAGSGDYHLTDSSTGVIDEGDTTLTDDYDGDSRPQNSGDDMGADERYIAP